MNATANAVSVADLATPTLFTDLERRVARGRADNAWVIATLAELEARGAHRERGFSSMFQFCVRRLRLAEASALKRIRAGRAARDFPALLEAVADGRLHLTAVVLLAPHLTAANVGEWIAAATHKTRREIEALLAARFPTPDLPTVVLALSESAASAELDLDPVRAGAGAGPPAEARIANAARPNDFAIRQLDPDPVAPRVAPLSAERFGLQVTISREAHELLRRAQELLGHATGPNDVERVLTRALATLVEQLERRKLGATQHPRTRRSDGATRYVPAEVRREVHARDQGQCTFVGADGHRCEARSRLEFDHVTPVAKGGRSTTANLRLRCRAHNQLEAERAYGAEFMRRKREAAAAERSAAEVLPWLRQLGVRAQDARRAIALGAASPDSPLEARVRAALRHLAPGSARRTGGIAPGPA